MNLAPSWNMPWQGAQYKGKVAVLDDYRETISLALLRAGNLDLNTTSTAQIQAAGRALQQLSALTTCGSTTTTTPTCRPGRRGFTSRGRATWRCPTEYLPKGTSVDTIGYWFPPDRKGPVANDLMVNLTGGANPVLAHKFIDYMLDVNNALENFCYVGYMQPLTEVTPQRLVSEKLLVPAAHLDRGAAGLLPRRPVRARAPSRRRRGLGVHLEHVLQGAVGRAR